MIVLAPLYIDTVGQSNVVSMHNISHVAIDKMFYEHFERMEMLLDGRQCIVKKKYFKVNKRTNYEASRGEVGLIRNYYMIIIVSFGGRPVVSVDLGFEFF